MCDFWLHNSLDIQYFLCYWDLLSYNEGLLITIVEIFPLFKGYRSTLIFVFVSFTISLNYIPPLS